MSTLLAYVQCGVHQVLLWEAVFHLGGTQHVLMYGVILSQVQSLSLFLVELHEVPLSPFLQPLHISLNSSTTGWWHQQLHLVLYHLQAR